MKFTVMRVNNIVINHFSETKFTVKRARKKNSFDLSVIVTHDIFVSPGFKSVTPVTVTEYSWKSDWLVQP